MDKTVRRGSEEAKTHANVRINGSHRILYTFPSFRYIKSTFKINLHWFPIPMENLTSDSAVTEKSLTFLHSQHPALVPLTAAFVPLNAGRLDPQASRILVPGSHSPPATNLIKLVWEGAWALALLNAPCFISMCSQG